MSKIQTNVYSMIDINTYALVFEKFVPLAKQYRTTELILYTGKKEKIISWYTNYVQIKPSVFKQCKKFAPFWCMKYDTTITHFSDVSSFSYNDVNSFNSYDIGCVTINPFLLLKYK